MVLKFFQPPLDGAWIETREVRKIFDRDLKGRFESSDDSVVIEKNMNEIACLDDLKQYFLRGAEMADQMKMLLIRDNRDLEADRRVKCKNQFNARTQTINYYGKED